MNISRAIKKLSEAGYSITYVEKDRISGSKPGCKPIVVTYNTANDEATGIFRMSKSYRNIDLAILENNSKARCL